MRLAFGAAALAILIPQHAFPGADMLDWIGLGGAVAVLAINYVQNRAGKRTAAPQRRSRNQSALARLVAFAPEAERFLRRPVGDREQHRFPPALCG